MERTFLEQNNQLTVLNNNLSNDIISLDNKNVSLVFDNKQQKNDLNLLDKSIKTTNENINELILRCECTLNDKTFIEKQLSDIKQD